MALQGEPVAHNDLVNSSQTTLHSHAGGGGGVTPAIYYAQGAGTGNLGTSFSTLDWAAAAISDTGYSESGGVITISSALNGKVARIDWALEGSGATNRVEIRTQLRVDSSVVATSSNYSARNTTQAQGGVAGFHYLTLSTGDQIDLQALRDGSTANLITTGTMLSIETKS